MSTPKKEIKTEPPKAPRKRAAPKKAQRVAEVEPSQPVTFSIDPVGISSPVYCSKCGMGGNGITGPICALEGCPKADTAPSAQTIISPAATSVKVSEPEHITIPQVEEEVKQRAVGVWSKIKAWWGKWGWIPVLAILATAILFIYLYVQSGKSNKAAKETQKTEAKITDGKARLNESAYNITANALKTVDSAITVRIRDINILWEERNRIIENEKEKNAQSKLKSDENKKNILTADTVELNRRARN